MTTRSNQKGTERPRLGIALGGGGARGWAHLGVLAALDEAGYRPDIVCGTSIGALVGAAYLTGYAAGLEEWVRGLTWARFLRLFDVQLLRGGFIEGERFMDAVRPYIGDADIESLDRTFGAVATRLDTGQEIWLHTGSLQDAVRASTALPGLFTPVHHDGAWLVDGGLVNPVPVSVCRAFGADLVLAVNLNGNIVGKHTAAQATMPPSSLIESDILSRLTGQLRRALRDRDAPDPDASTDATPQPGLFDVMAGSINIMQDRITRSRMAGDPPELLLAPRLAHIGILEFGRAADAIDAGRRATEALLPSLEDTLGR